MIYEMRRYILQPGKTGEWVRAFCEAYEVRAQYSPLGALFQTEIGPLNEVIHIWPYENLQHRADTRAAASKDTSGKWPPSSASHLIVTQETDILDPIPGVPDWDGTPQEWGGIYELRQYTYAPGDIRNVAKAFGEALPGRNEIYPVAGIFTSQLGNLNRLFQLFPYKDWTHRDEIRKVYLESGAWPPHSDARPVQQLVRHMLPAACSTLH